MTFCAPGWTGERETQLGRVGAGAVRIFEGSGSPGKGHTPGISFGDLVLFTGGDKGYSNLWRG